MNYKEYRIVDGPRWVIADEFGKIINKYPSKEKLIRLKQRPWHLVADGNCKSRPNMRYTREELLEYPRKFYRDEGRPPTEKDFAHNPNFPSVKTYQNYFGSWENALKSVGLDTESMAKKGILEIMI